MKASTIIGVASLAINFALLGLIAVGALNDSRPTVRSTSVETPAIAKNAVDSISSPEAWSELGSMDLPAQRDRLQAEGFPPAAVRAILAAEIREKFSARRKAIEAGSASQPVWKNAMPDSQTQAQLRALAKEEQSALKNLLGADSATSAAAKLRRQFPELTSEKVDQLIVIRERYDEQRQEIYGVSRGEITRSDREKAFSLEKAMHKEFAAVLTPAELENYDLRMGNTANNLRRNLRTFEATEEEFRALYKLQSEFNDQFASFGSSTQEQMRARGEAQKQLDEQIAAALGAARYSDYQRSTDYNFQQVSQLVARFGFPTETASSLYAVQKEFEERRNTLLQASTPEARAQMTQHLTTLQQEATTRVATVLGGNQTAVKAYKQYGGFWLKQLVPQPTPPSKK